MELFRLLGTIAIQNNDAIDALEETSDQGEKTESKLKTAFGKIGSAAAKVGKVVAAGMAVGGAALVAIGKQAVESYAEYEQLAGGVETLFKDSADTVMQYAQNAYKTAGLSANEYMETVTSFSASLLQSLGGDTEKAAKLADLAITDMSDNANKMGTSMEAIQNAYNGFSKQNYTMLDNLKLGFGGTKEEMQRLLDEAEKLSGIKYDISSYADIVEAIHVIQTEMGITGTTAREASTTIQGAITSMKSAWKNLLTGLADENQNLEELFGQLVDSVVIVASNIIPRIQKLLPRIVSAVVQMAQLLAAELPEIVKSVMTSLATSIQESFGMDVQPTLAALGSIITEVLVPAIELVMIWIKKLVDFAQKNLGFLKDIFQAAINILTSIIEAFTAATQGDWEGFWQAIVKIVKNIGSALKSAGKGIFDMLWSGLKSVWSSIQSWVSSKFSWITDKLNAVKSALSNIGAAVTEAATTSAATRVAKATSKVSAHAAGGILTKPTIFGYTPATNTYHLGGEAGAEAIAPIDVLQGYVREAVAEANQNATSDKIYEILAKILYMLQNNKITAVMDGEKMGEFVIQTVEREVYA